MTNVEHIILSDKYTIYKSADPLFEENRSYLLDIIKANHSYSLTTGADSVSMEINSIRFRRINELIKKLIENVTGRKFIDYAEHSWIFTQSKGYELEWMHQHLYVHPPGRTKIATDFTFTYYIQVPNDLQGQEGQLVFQTEDKVKHFFLPKEGDIFIFPGDIRHTAIPSTTSDTDRIVYAGSLCIDIFNQTKIEKTLL